MKKKKKTSIIIFSIISLLIVFAVIFGVINGKQIVLNMLYYSTIKTHDVRNIDLSSVKDIKIIDNNQTLKISENDEKYKIICHAFDKKRVKTSTDIHFCSDTDYKIEISTEKQKYVLYGSPGISVYEEDNDIKYDKYIDFVLYNYSNEHTNELLYQIVRIRTKDFLKIFPDFPERLQKS